MNDSDDVTVTVKTAEGGPSAAAVAEFLGGLAIMREAVSLSDSGERGAFVSRFGALRLPFFWMPDMLLETCGNAWSLMDDWPPMHPAIRGALSHSLLEACGRTGAPVVRRITQGSVEAVLHDWGKAIGNTAGGLKEKVLRAIAATRLLIGKPRRAECRQEVMSVLELEPMTATGAMRTSLAWMGLAEPNVGMMALGTAMISCRAMENAYSALGATGLSLPLDFPDEEPPPGGRATKRTRKRPRQ